MSNWLQVFPIIAVCVSSAIAAPQVTIEALESTSGYQPYPTQLNANGTSFSGRGLSGSERGLRWTPSSGIEILDTSWAGSTQFSIAWCIAPETGAVFGDVVLTSGGYRACVWPMGGGGQLLQLPSVPSSFDSHVYATNANGTVCVGTYYSGISQPALWANGVGQVIQLPPTLSSAWFHGVSADGQVVCGNASPVGGQQRAFRWTAGGSFQLLELPPGWVNSTTRCISDDGLVIAGESGAEPFRWTAATGSVALAMPAGWLSATTYGINGDGTILVGSAGASPTNKAWIWTPLAGVQSLEAYLAAAGADLTGWAALRIASDISSDSSTIVGVGTYMGQERTFRVTGLACSSRVIRDSGPLGAIGAGIPKECIFSDLRQTTSSVTLRVRVVGDFDLASEFLTVRVDGTPIGTAFVAGAHDCPSAADVATLTIPMKQFNALAADGSVLIRLEASPAANAAQCASGSCDVRIVYDGALADCDGDGAEDRCQIFGDPSLDCDRNGVLDSCQPVGSYPDCDGNLIPDSCDLEAGAQDKDSDSVLDACEYARGDFDLDGIVAGPDLSVLLSLWGFTSPPIGDLNGDGLVAGADLGILLSNWGTY